MCVKKIVGVLRAAAGTPHPKKFTSAIIAAAGMSERFGGDVTKQMSELCGKPLLIHTLEAFENADCIHEIIIVAKSNEIPVWQTLCREYNISKLTNIVQGGYTRQESVLCGFEAVNKKSKYVAIADGARCLITPDLINKVCRSAYKYKAATAAHRSTDTVKIADKKGFIESTADRDTVWLAQTPQVFKTRLYRAAAYTALKKGFEATDDNSLVENVGHPIRLVECGSQNIKITTRDDIAVAEGILAERARIEKYYNYED
ncbi:MAG: 2-C-methyl-D-erythritol 4-phosphate cytidylyltransferase [Clostridia bacterium]|nr:2-C-methyl-D-erythritol 4-phosphate cytidylyltransferase [Clostridia bacterium]